MIGYYIITKLIRSYCNGAADDLTDDLSKHSVVESERASALPHGILHLPMSIIELQRYYMNVVSTSGWVEALKSGFDGLFVYDERVLSYVNLHAWADVRRGKIESIE